MSTYYSNKTLLIPFDFSDAARQAVDESMNIGDESTRLCFLHVLIPLHSIAVEPVTIVDYGSDDERIQDAIKRMQKLIQDTNHHVEFDARIGDPGFEICDYAKEIGADLIVMPSHGRTGIKRLLLGSVAERVVRTAECPVMVLRKPRS